ncbi:MAG: hypothetical protein FCKEOINB_01272 [Nitrosomonas sp.]|nr:hypothetical protein [Nitrosomonas sp.]
MDCAENDFNDTRAESIEAYAVSFWGGYPVNMVHNPCANHQWCRGFSRILMILTHSGSSNIEEALLRLV